VTRGERAMVPDAEPRTYYDLPILKGPVWSWEIPAYFFSGGVAAGTALLAAGAELAGDHQMARRMQFASFGSIVASSGFLVADLGVPRRFHHMLRVAKPTSPMSVGSWLLTAFGAASSVATVSTIIPGAQGIRRTAQMTCAALAPLIATYTGVLISDTAVPVWHEARDLLPCVFAAGAAASSGAAGIMLLGPTRASVRKFALAGIVAEIATTRVMKRRLGPLISKPYQQGRVAVLDRMAEGSTALGGLLVLVGGRRRRVAWCGAALAFTGAALERFAIAQAGKESARDPRYTVVPQRAGRALAH
jgi:hypothetical protein